MAARAGVFLISTVKEQIKLKHIPSTDQDGGIEAEPYWAGTLNTDPAHLTLQMTVYK